MAVTSNVNKNKFLSIAASVVLGLAAVIGLQACSSSGGGTPETQDASGLFKSGTANLNAGAVVPTDVRAFVHGGRIIAFSISSHILFDGQITNITGDDFTATVDLYETGEMTQADIAVTGKVTSQSQITGTLAGTGVGNGTFTLVYDAAYNTAATLARITKPVDWEGNWLTTFSFNTDVDPDDFDMFDTDSFTMKAFDTSSSVTDICLFVGDVTIPDSTINIYMTLSDIPAGGSNDTTCTSLDVAPLVKYTGFSAVLSESNTDNDLLFAHTNGTNSVFGILTQP